MTVAIKNVKTGEELLVLLEIGHDLWVRNEFGKTERASAAHFPPERWQFLGANPSMDDIPVPIGAPLTHPINAAEARP